MTPARERSWRWTPTTKTDLYNREVYKSDLGGHVTTSLFDAAGRLISRTVDYTTQTYQWYNTGLLKQNVSTSGTESYGYDAVGQRISQVLVSGGVTLVDAQASYDALGRLTSWNQNAATYTNGSYSYTTEQANNAYYYDAGGNVRRQVSSYRTIWDTGYSSSLTTTQDYWFRYDAMNRLVLDRGKLSGTAGASGTQIVRRLTPGNSNSSLAIFYDAAGQRIATTTLSYTDGYYAGYWWEGSYVPIGYIPGNTMEARENYDYDGAGQIKAISVTYGTRVDDYYDPATYTWVQSSTPPAAASSGGALLSTFVYDLVGRQTQQNDYTGSSVVYSRYATYDAAGKLTNDYGSTVKSDGTYSTSNWYSYTTSSGEYLLGAVASISSSNSKNGGSYTYPTTTNAYQWWDSAVQSSIAISGPGGTTTSSFYYDGLGRLTTVYISDGRSRTVNFRTNGDGQIIRRDEQDGNTSMGDPHEVWYRFGGRQMAYVGNNGTTNMSETASLAERRTVTGNGAFRAGATSAILYADTTGSYDAINSYRQGSSAGGYTVQHTGENLRGIASALWGDASLWYKLAEANGLQADASLVEGQRLTVPAGVIRNTFNANTVKPYDPASAVGDVSPSTPLPLPAPKKKGCGFLGAILGIIIGVVVSIVLPGIGQAIGKAIGKVLGQVVGNTLGTAIGTMAGGAIQEGLINVVTQGISVAVGIQEKFDWKGVGISAIGGGLGPIDVKPTGSPFLNKVVSRSLTNLRNQGVATAVGLQDGISWAGVAAAGLGYAIGDTVSSKLAGKGFLGIKAGKASYGNQALSGTAEALAYAATRSAIEGTNFGDNVLAAMPQVIGSTLARALGEVGMKVAASLEQKKTADTAGPVGQAVETTGDRAAAAIQASGGGGGGALGLAGMQALAYLPSPEELLRLKEQQEQSGEWWEALDPIGEAQAASATPSNNGDVHGGDLEAEFDAAFDHDAIVVYGDKRGELEKAFDSAFGLSWPYNAPAAPAPVTSAQGSTSYDLGILSKRYESGGAGAGTVSSGQGDLGGVSYGTYQFTSRFPKWKNGKVVGFTVGGTVKSFLNSSEGGAWAREFNGMTPGSLKFSEKWREIAARDHQNFANAQHDFIERTHYAPAVSRVLAGSGFDLDGRSDAIRNVAWSVSVQHGGAESILRKAISLADASSSRISVNYDRILINKIYDVRSSYIISNKVPGAQGIISGRYTSERRDALLMLDAKYKIR